VTLLERLTRWQSARSIVTHILNAGSSADGLRWIERNRPELLVEVVQKKKKRGAKSTARYLRGQVKCAINKGEPDILEWLLARGVLDLARDGPALAAKAAKSAKVAAWLKKKKAILDS
jgi:hypothetical protein